MVSDPLPPLLPRWDCIWICNGSKSIICMCLRLSRLSKCAGVPPERQREIERECRPCQGKHIPSLCLGGYSFYRYYAHKLNYLHAPVGLTGVCSSEQNLFPFNPSANTMRRHCKTQTDRQTDGQHGRQAAAQSDVHFNMRWSDWNYLPWASSDKFLLFSCLQWKRSVSWFIRRRGSATTAHWPAGDATPLASNRSPVYSRWCQQVSPVPAVQF